MEIHYWSNSNYSKCMKGKSSGSRNECWAYQLKPALLAFLQGNTAGGRQCVFLTSELILDHIQLLPFTWAQAIGLKDYSDFERG